MDTMKTNASRSINTPETPFRIQRNWLGLFFVFLALLLGLTIAVSVGYFGVLVLLAVPALLIFAGISGQPDIGLAAVIFMLVTQLTQVLRIHHSLPSPAQPLMALLAVVIIIRLILYGDRPLGWKRIAPMFTALVLSWIVSVLNAKDFGLAFDDFINIMTNVAVAVIIVYFVRSADSFRRAIWTLIIAGIFMGTISVFQNFTGTFDNLYWGFGGWELDFSSGSSRHRLTGPFANPNAYAQVLIVIVPLALDRFWHERNKLLRLLAAWAVGVSVLAIFFTYSRNGFLTLVITLGLLVVITRPNIAPLIITAALGLGVLQLMPASYLDRVSSLTQISAISSGQVTDGSFKGRVSENTAAWMMFRDYPLFGVGLDNYQLYYQEYSRQIGLDNRRETREPASYYLELLSEGGLVGITAFFFFIVWVFRGLRKARKQFHTLEMYDQAHMVTALLVGLTGYMIFYISKNSAYSNVYWVLIGLALSMTQVASSSMSNGRDHSDPALEIIQ